MRNVISHFAFQILPFGFVAKASGIPNLELIRDIVKIDDFLEESEKYIFA
jgi:hypothetical protein